MSEAGRRWLAPQLQAAEPTADEPGPSRVTSLALARNLAAGIVSRAEEQARQAAEQARAEGLRSGLEEGQRQLAERQSHLELAAQAQLNEELERLGALFCDSQTRLWGEVRDNLVSLVLGLTERLLGERLEHQPELLLPSLDQALGELSRSAEITLRLHPEDLERLRRRLAGEGLRLLADPALRRGDFLAEGSQGVVDGRLQTRLSRLQDGLNLVAAFTEGPPVEGA